VTKKVMQSFPFLKANKTKPLVFILSRQTMQDKQCKAHHFFKTNKATLFLFSREQTQSLYFFKTNKVKPLSFQGKQCKVCMFSREYASKQATYSSSCLTREGFSGLTREKFSCVDKAKAFLALIRGRLFLS